MDRSLPGRKFPMDRSLPGPEISPVHGSSASESSFRSAMAPAPLVTFCKYRYTPYVSAYIIAYFSADFKQNFLFFHANFLTIQEHSPPVCRDRAPDADPSAVWHPVDPDCESILHYAVCFSVRKAYNVVGMFTGISADAENARQLP